MDNIPLIFVCLLILGAELVNGWTDAPNAIATVISTRALSPFQAILMAAIFNLLGVFSGTAVAATLGTEIIDPRMITLTTIGCAMIGVIFWGSLTAKLGLPISETHALVSGLAGAGVATGGLEVLVWEGWTKVMIGLFFSTFLGFVAGFILMILVYRIGTLIGLAKGRRVFRYLQVCSSAFVAFSHGSNDGQKFMGVFTLALLMNRPDASFEVPIWVIFTCALVMGLGTLFGGWRIMRTMGFRITHLETPQGFAVEMGAGTTITIASHLGIPLSTTHTINTAIMGVGATRRFSAVRWGITGKIVTAWLFTFPMCALISFSVTKLLLWLPF